MSVEVEVSRTERGVVKWKDFPCWVWPRALNAYGYGIQGSKRKTRNNLVHIALYEYFIGPVPFGKELDHLCRNTECVCPWHMEAVTHRKNIIRGIIQTKLTYEDVVEIRKLLAMGMSGPKIADRFGVTRQSVYGIRKGVSWRSRYRPEGIGKWQPRPRKGEQVYV